MNRKREILNHLAIAVLALWLGLSAFTDFFVIRTAFEITGDFFKAGDLGIALFGKLNRFEIVFASFLLIEVVLNPGKSRFLQLVKLLLTLVLFSIALTYFSYLTPKIMELTDFWKEADKLGTLSFGGIADVQTEHQFFHRLYIGLDTVKMLLLSVLLGAKI